MTESIRGVAAGVPFIAVPPSGGGPAPLVVVWHLLDAPRTEVAMAAALPLTGVPAWRVYLGLPFTGARMPPGGLDEIMALVRDDTLLNLHGAAITQAAAELPAVLEALRKQLPASALVDEPLTLIGGSAGGAVALLTFAELERPVRALVAINAAIRATSVVALVERSFGIEYEWSEESRRLAGRLDFVARAGEFPEVPVLIVSGEHDHDDFRADAVALREALPGARLVVVAGLAHPLALEPGLEAAAQTPEAREVDAVVGSFSRSLMGSGSER
ncbi:alpha/beta hydrolase [Cryptosporangium phraense]|uniref:Alpha/beta hydrolase n=1 Tax=Cryptosporangium phraense TaxID=2593070 RepID=A0A545AY76_9ACTN|nr:alpha/beta hydrolase [Cryptosporangium phraense]TQS46268.1 alpha/beta hydrolase [Cryptosporangium phraense]